MSRIVTVVGRCGPGRTCGAERMAQRTTQAMRRAGHDAVLLEGSGPWPDLRPDIVNAFDLADPGPVLAARALAERTGAAFVLTPASTWRLWPDREVAARLCRDARMVFALNAAEARHLRQLGVAAERLRTVPNAPDLTGTPQPARFRRRYGVDGDIVLFLGRRLPTKGAGTVRDAAPAVLRRHPGTTFVFAGPGTGLGMDTGSGLGLDTGSGLDDDGGAGLGADAGPWSGAGRMRDLGLLDEQTKHDALAACAVLCLPTTADVFPLVFLEAWACARPVVSGRFTGVEDVVRHGVDGLVVAADPASVADALDLLLSDPQLRDRLGCAGLRRVTTELSWDRVAAAYLAGYRSAGYRTAEDHEEASAP